MSKRPGAKKVEHDVARLLETQHIVYIEHVVAVLVVRPIVERPFRWLRQRPARVRLARVPAVVASSEFMKGRSKAENSATPNSTL